MATRIHYIVLSLALVAPALFVTTGAAQSRRAPATSSDTQTRKDDDSKKTDDKAVKRQQKEDQKRDQQAAKQRDKEDKKRQDAERRNRDQRSGDDRAGGRAEDRHDQNARPRPPAVVERTRVVFVGGYFYDPVFGRYPWWSPVVYRHPVIVFEGRAQVRLQVTPRSAAVYVDGFYAGVVDDFDGFFERLPLLPGGHTIALYLEGFRTMTRSVYLSPGSELRIREDLLPLLPGMASEAPTMSAMLPPPPPGSYLPPYTAPLGQPRPPTVQAGNPAAGFGVLSLRFRPPDAVVTIDGQEWLTAAPGELVIHLGAGVHVIGLKAAGYQSFSRDVEIRDGETAELNVSVPRQTTR
jgi:PEGA domain